MADVVNTNQFKSGMAIEIDGEPDTIVETQHVKPGKGGAFVRTKVRSIKTGNVLDKTFRAGEKFTRIHTSSRTMTYLYATESEVVLMDPESYEQISVNPAMAAEALKWVVENQDVQMLMLDGAPFSVEAPNHVELTVAHSDPGLRGDTATGGTKPAELETGVTIQVPLFIGPGERVRVDTRTGAYITRV